jgi:hypothetical protein
MCNGSNAVVDEFYSRSTQEVEPKSYYETLRDLYDNEEEDLSPSELAGRMDQDLNSALQNSNVKDLGDFTQYIDVFGEPMVEVPLSVLEGLIDIAEDFLFEEKAYRAEKSPQYKHSRIRVQLSRPLTVAESEKLSTDHHVIGGRLNVSRRRDDGFLFKLRVSPNRTHVWVDADLPSRPLYDVVAAALDSHFVNVYPTAVRTFTEYHA